jgi:signal transduction histidine kinase
VSPPRSSTPGSRSCASWRGGLHPGALTDYGLEGALKALGTRLPLPVEFDVTDERLGGHIEATAYFIVSETLTNVVKHAKRRPRP